MEDIEQRRNDRWNFLFIAGMWFQDLFNYDFRRTEQCIIPYATQEGEISFWRLQHGRGLAGTSSRRLHMTSTLTKWYEAAMAVTRSSPVARRSGMNEGTHTLAAEPGACGRCRQRHLREVGYREELAREEKIRARDAKLKQDAENARMAKLYRENILGEKAPEGGFVAIGSIAPAVKPTAAPSVQTEKAEENSNGRLRTLEVVKFKLAATACCNS